MPLLYSKKAYDALHFAGLSTVCGCLTTLWGAGVLAVVDPWAAAGTAALGMAGLGSVPVFILITRYKPNYAQNATSYLPPAGAYVGLSTATTYLTATALGFAHPASYAAAAATGGGTICGGIALAMTVLACNTKQNESCEPLFLRDEDEIAVVQVPADAVIQANGNSAELLAATHAALHCGARPQTLGEFTGGDQEVQRSILERCGLYSSRQVSPTMI